MLKTIQTLARKTAQALGMLSALGGGIALVAGVAVGLVQPGQGIELAVPGMLVCCAGCVFLTLAEA